MKYNVILLITVLISSNLGYACNACACFNMPFQAGIMPNFIQQKFGLNQNLQQFSARDELGANSKDIIHTIAYTQSISLGNNFQLDLTIPFKSILRDKTSISGISDAQTILSWSLPWISGLSSNPSQIEVGIGLSIPIGDNSLSRRFSDLPTFQLGTGVPGLISKLSSNIRLSEYYVQIAGQYLNWLYDETDFHYQYGNQLFISSVIGRTVINTQQYSIYSGVQFEYISLQQDLEFAKFNLYNNISGGYSTDFGIHSTIQTKRFSVSGQVQIPISQNLSSGYISKQYSCNMQLSYFL